MEKPPQNTLFLLLTRYCLPCWELNSLNRITFFTKLIFINPFSIKGLGEKGGKENV
jgi:hypothetical protein